MNEVEAVLAQLSTIPLGTIVSLLESLVGELRARTERDQVAAAIKAADAAADVAESQVVHK